MQPYFEITNKSMELSECVSQWTLDEEHQCWCLEDVIYTPVPTTPAFQRLSIFVPKAYLNTDGTINRAGAMGKFTAVTAPVLFENNSAGYAEMPNVWLGGPRCYAEQYLARGMVYVTCGCRGRESENAEGELVGKAPAMLVDLKTAIRFLRHNQSVIPGDFNRIVSIGWSAAGALSTLLGVTGDNENYLPYLKENGAFLGESDAIYASQIYCPIIDLEHADMAYEWMFQADKECEDSPAGPAETMTPFKEALSKELAGRYVKYFNGLKLKNPDTGEVLQFAPDGRSGNAYEYFMAQLEASATDFLTRLEAGTLEQQYSAEDYLSGNYTKQVMEFMPPDEPDASDEPFGKPLPAGAPPVHMSMGMALLRPPKGAPVPPEPFMKEVPGEEKSAWLTWDGKKARIKDLDTYVQTYRRRMKPCTSFDKLTNDSGENQLFGTPEKNFMHFSKDTMEAIAALQKEYPKEAQEMVSAYEEDLAESGLDRRLYLINPWNFLGTSEKSKQAKHYRVRVGGCDADTSLSVSMALALKLASLDMESVDYGIVWDLPHCEADYPGEAADWIERICES